MKIFKSIIEFQKHFDTDEKCRAYLEEQRWGGAPACPHCGSINVCRFNNGSGVFKCREKVCRKKFTVTVGTVYQDRKLPLTKIFLAVYVLSVHSKGISSLQLANLLDISQKAAWLLNHKVRAMLKEGEKELLRGEIELDETWIGGREKNKHKRKRVKPQPPNTIINAMPPQRTWADKKSVLFALLQRGGKLRVRKVDNAKAKTLLPIMVANVAPESTIYTDEHVGYINLPKLGYTHDTVRHSADQYVKGRAHVNSVEGFWALLKRQINGIHHQVSPKHLQRYADEVAFRYNRKKDTQDERFAEALKQVDGQLQWKKLTAG